MDLAWPDDVADFRSDLREWLGSNLEGRVFPELRRPDTVGPLRDWERCLFEADLAAIHWPTEFGGRGADTLRAAVFFEEYIRSGAPDRLNRQALSLAAPTIMAAGTQAQKERWLRNILSCEEIWCQGFSEPDAGSDLVSLRTRAERHGEMYVVDGQKTWTSNGPIADWIFALVRTDPEAPKHRGITYLMIDLHTPGVEVRPIRQVNGHGDFAEVFFTGVEVPVENRIGEENRGWQIAMTTLSIERGAGVASAAQVHGLVEDVEALMRATDGFDNAGLRTDFTRLRAQAKRYQLNAYAALSSDRPESVRALGAIHKLTWSTLQVALYELGMRALGGRVELGNQAVPAGVRRWHERYWLARASLIYSGTNEIQRNIIAERVLGLPKDAYAR